MTYDDAADLLAVPGDCATRYRCRDCGQDKAVPERPSDCPRSIRTGCEGCGRITRHGAVGMPP
jgi:hypothetical protein